MYERNIHNGEKHDIKVVAFAGNVVYNGSAFSDKGIDINGGFGGVGFTTVSEYRKNTKWEAGFKFFRLNSGDVKRAFFPSVHIGLRWRYQQALLRIGYEYTGGLYLSGGYLF